MTPPTLELLGENANLPEATRRQLQSVATSVSPHATLPEVTAFFDAARSGSQPRLFDALRALQGSTRAELVSARETIRAGAIGVGDPFDQLTMYMERGAEQLASGVRSASNTMGISDTQAAQWTSQTVNRATEAYQQYIPPALRLPVFGALIGGGAWLLSKPMEWLGFNRAARWSRTVGKAAWEASKWAAIGKVIGDLLNRGFKGGIVNLVPPAWRNSLPAWFRS